MTVYGDGSRPRPSRSASLRENARQPAATDNTTATDTTQPSSPAATRTTADKYDDDVDESHYSEIGSPTSTLEKQTNASSTTEGDKVPQSGTGITTSTSSVITNTPNLTISITNSSTGSEDTGIQSNTTLDSSCASPKDLEYFSSQDSGFVSSYVYVYTSFVNSNREIEFIDFVRNRFRICFNTFFQELENVKICCLRTMSFANAFHIISGLPLSFCKLYS